MINFTDNFQKYTLPNFGYTRLPKPPISIEEKLKFGCNENDNNYVFLEKICILGLNSKIQSGKINKDRVEEYENRLKLELSTFKELGFTDYILLVWTVINKAKSMGMFMDFGRGSVGSSLVAWLTDITGCDPIYYNLFFSRFVSKARAKSKIIDNETWISIDLAPDIDINLAEGRDEIVEWLKQIYPNRISKVANVSTLTGKILIKDVYKCLEEVSEDEAKDVADLIERRFGVVQDIEEVKKENKEFEKWVEDHKETYEISLKLRHLNTSFGCHASGYLVSFDELDNHTPAMLNKEREQMSSYIMGDVQCLKLDLLSLDTNRIIKNILSRIPEKVEDINLHDDKFIYDKLQSDNLLPYGLYQISADCAYKVCKHLKPKNVLELSHVNAIARPTALAYEKPYIDNSAECPHPIFESALNWTRNLPLYQEQTIMLVKALGFSDDESEQFRRVAAKKKTDEIKEWVDKINSNIKRKGLSEDITKFLLKLIGDSANYQFNLAHSVSTSYLTALTVYLKYKYPLEFYWACLNEVKEKPNSNELIGQIFSELKQMGIELLSPNILKSETDFTIEKNGIRFGLGNLKGLGEKAINKLQEFKDEFQNPFEIFSGALESGLNFTSMSSLIQSGSMDDFIKNGRCYTVLELGLWKELTPRERKKILIDQLGEKFNYDLVSIVKSLSKTENVELKPFIKESRLETLRKDFKPYNDMYKLNIKNEPLANYMAEKTYLGYSYSQNLFNILKKEYYDLVSIYEAKTELPEQKVTVGGEVLEYREGKSKNNNRYIKAKISDSTGETDIMLMEKYFEKNDEMNNGRKLQIGDIVCAIGRTSKDIIFCDRIVNQNVKIAHTPAQLKNIN